MADEEKIAKLCRTLQPRNQVRVMAESVLSDPHGPIGDLRPFENLLRDMPNRVRRERTIISWLACNVPWSEDQRSRISDVLANLICTGVKLRTYSRSVFVCARNVLFLLFVVFALIGSVLIVPPYVDRSVAMFDFVAYGMVMCIILRFMVMFVSGPLTRWFDNGTVAQFAPCAEVLGKIGSSSSICSLAEAYMHRPLRESVAPALAKVAARLKPEDYGAQPAQTLPALCSVLINASPRMAVAILEALAIIGDGSAIDAVERTLIKTYRPQVREAALAVLPILRQRAEESCTSAMLLRPSSAAPEREQILLRAVREHGAADETQMLRASGD